MKKLLNNKKIEYALLSVWALFLFLFCIFLKMYNKYDPNKDGLLLDECKMIITEIESNDFEYDDNFKISLANHVNNLNQIATDNEENHYDYALTCANLSSSIQDVIDDNNARYELYYAYSETKKIINARNTFYVIWMISLIVFIFNFALWSPLFMVNTINYFKDKKNNKIKVDNNL